MGVPCVALTKGPGSEFGYALGYIHWIWFSHTGRPIWPALAVFISLADLLSFIYFLLPFHSTDRKAPLVVWFTATAPTHSPNNERYKPALRRCLLPMLTCHRSNIAEGALGLRNGGKGACVVHWPRRSRLCGRRTRRHRERNGVHGKQGATHEALGRRGRRPGMFPAACVECDRTLTRCCKWKKNVTDIGGEVLCGRNNHTPCH